ncbi:hypothetical protein Tco_0578525 [Tanacetum coccineum]
MCCDDAYRSRLVFPPWQVRSRLVSDSTTRDVEWEPIEEERLEEPKEGWMLGESKKRSIRSFSQMLIVGLVPRSRVTLVKASRIRELVVKNKAEKVYHEEMVKMPLVDLRMLEVYTKSKKEYESHLKMNLELLKKEKCHVKPNKVETKKEGDYLYDTIIRDSCEERYDSRYGLRRDGDVRTLIMEEAHATKYFVRPGVIENETQRSPGLLLQPEIPDWKWEKERLTMDSKSKLSRSDEAVTRHGVHVSSIPDKDGMYIEVLERDVEVVRNTSRYEACVRNLVVVGILTFREDEIKESKMIGLELEQETTKVVMIKERLKKAKDLSPWKGVVCFGKKGELAPSCYVAIRTFVWVSKVISSKIPIVKVSCDPSSITLRFTWVMEDNGKISILRLFVGIDAVEPFG